MIYRHRCIIKLTFQIEQYEPSGWRKTWKIMSTESNYIYERLRKRLKLSHASLGPIIDRNKIRFWEAQRSTKDVCRTEGTNCLRKKETVSFDNGNIQKQVDDRKERNFCFAGIELKYPNSVINITQELTKAINYPITWHDGSDPQAKKTLASRFKH